ncbi:hypothetical protein [Streptomyces sp. NPDC001980]|uniref:hypothetical protein n=1 Tax=Streptomyces sp. NPDC001980 TaxID=3157126 RepID=UPI00332035EB
MGAWLARYAADPVDELGDRLVGLAVDGKTVRGSRTDSSASTCWLPRCTPARP